MSEQRIANALEIAMQYGGIDGSHHKDWVVDQMVRALTGCKNIPETVITDGERRELVIQVLTDEYETFVAEAKNGENGPETYEWPEGIAP